MGTLKYCSKIVNKPLTFIYLVSTNWVLKKNYNNLQFNFEKIFGLFLGLPAERTPIPAQQAAHG
jgi:hypothetical protein